MPGRRAAWCMIHLETKAHFGCRSVVSDSLQPHGLPHTRLPCPSPTPGAFSNSCPSSRWCHPTTSSSVIPFSSCLQSSPGLGSFLMRQLFTSGGQSLEDTNSSSANESIPWVNQLAWFLSLKRQNSNKHILWEFFFFKSEEKGRKRGKEGDLEMERIWTGRKLQEWKDAECLFQAILKAIKHRA